MYNGGTMFTDYASMIIFAFNQISLQSGKTLQGKHIVDKEDSAIGHPIKSFYAGNSVYTSAAFKEDLGTHNQIICFSGVGAAYENRIAEHNLKTTFYLAGALLILPALCWPTENSLTGKSMMNSED
eukprot:3407291-Ditylum_brightwellii.AAC.1